jgi:signal transduction histidine kinase
LETNHEPRFKAVDLVFLQRLAEHASIAISNAQYYAELRRASQSKSEFVSFVAHELKNPLTSIKGYADVLITGAAGGLTEAQKNFLGTIRANAERMNTLVSDLNDVTKLQTDNLRISLAPVDLREVVGETVRPFQKQIEDKGQQLTINVPVDLPFVLADHNRIIQVLTNLVSNAHKYTPPSGQIAIEAALERAEEQQAGQRVHISVRDSGIGMSQDDLDRLFTPYFRSDNPAAREQPGTGLGLTITRGIIQRHNGEVWVESAPGAGTRFHFTLPAVSESDAAAH